MILRKHRLVAAVLLALSVGSVACADEEDVVVRQPGVPPPPPPPPPPPAEVPPLPGSPGIPSAPPPASVDVGTLIHSAVNPALCLDVAGGRPAPRAPVQLFSCHGRENQRWNLAPGADGATITGIGGLCLDIRGVRSANGASAEVFPCNGGGNQQFRMLADGRMQEVSTGKCLTAMGDGAPLVVEPCDPGLAAQVFTVGR